MRSRWCTSIFAALICVTAFWQDAAAWTEVPVGINFPRAIADLYTEVSYDPQNRHRIGTDYIGGLGGVVRLGLPNTVIAPIAGVTKLATIGGLEPRMMSQFCNGRGHSLA